jgi:hypothetical protein
MSIREIKKSDADLILAIYNKVRFPITHPSRDLVPLMERRHFAKLKSLSRYNSNRTHGRTLVTCVTAYLPEPQKSLL